jgi:ribonuclease-3
MEFDELEKNIGVSFKNEDLLKEALTHRSYLNEHSEWKYPHNERLEYLGDAVLELAVSEELFSKYPEFPEGQLTILRAALVNWERLGKVGTEIGLQDFILTSRGERGDSGKAWEVILANAVEALIGAIYLDQGFPAAKKFVQKFILAHLPEILKNRSYRDAKSELQELIQEKKRLTPTYRVLEESGPAHRRTFRVGVYFGEELIAEGSGSSKQEAELNAAKQALDNMR